MLKNRYTYSGLPTETLIARTVEMIHEHETDGIPHREAVALALEWMPLRVVRAWAADVLLNGAPSSWSKARLIAEVTK